MTVETAVAGHYTKGDLFERIMAALEARGVDRSRIGPDDLKPVDEFHIGGIRASRELIGQLGLTADMRVLDIGSGIGGTARFVAGETGTAVTGIDLTPEFVKVAARLSGMVGLGAQTRFEVGSALDLPVGSQEFDAALLLHVGMNIEDKARMMEEAFRVLKPGGCFAVYDVMRIDDMVIDFPVPWSDLPETSFLARLEDYVHAAERAGFSVEASRDRRAFARQFFSDLKAKMTSEGLPPLGIHLLMGANAREKVANMVANISSGRITPTELILRKGVPG